VTNTPSADQFFFLGSNFGNGAGSGLYSFMMNNYKAIDAVLCKKDGIAAANFYRTVREETKTSIEYIISSQQPISEKEALLNKLFTDIKTVEIGERGIKKILEYKIRYYRSNADTLQLLQASRAYIKQFLLAPDQTASIGSETIIIDKNAPVPVIPVDSTRVSSFCSNYALTLSKLSKDVQDKELAASLFKKALVLNNSSVVKNSMNVATYYFGEKRAAIEQQSKLIAEMKTNNDEYLADAETTLQQMKNNEPKISGFLFRRKGTKK
jgi:hypothetical protein